MLTWSLKENLKAIVLLLILVPSMSLAQSKKLSSKEVMDTLENIEMGTHIERVIAGLAWSQSETPVRVYGLPSDTAIQSTWLTAMGYDRSPQNATSEDLDRTRFVYIPRSGIPEAEAHSDQLVQLPTLDGVVFAVDEHGLIKGSATFLDGLPQGTVIRHASGPLDPSFYSIFTGLEQGLFGADQRPDIRAARIRYLSREDYYGREVTESFLISNIDEFYSERDRVTVNSAGQTVYRVAGRDDENSWYYTPNETRMRGVYAIPLADSSDVRTFEPGLPIPERFVRKSDLRRLMAEIQQTDPHYAVNIASHDREFSYYREIDHAPSKREARKSTPAELRVDLRHVNTEADIELLVQQVVQFSKTYSPSGMALKIVGNQPLKREDNRKKIYQITHALAKKSLEGELDLENLLLKIFDTETNDTFYKTVQIQEGFVTNVHGGLFSEISTDSETQNTLALHSAVEGIINRLESTGEEFWVSLSSSDRLGSAVFEFAPEREIYLTDPDTADAISENFRD